MPGGVTTVNVTGLLVTLPHSPVTTTSYVPAEACATFVNESVDYPAHIARIRFWKVSAIKMFSRASTATPLGYHKLAWVAGMPSEGVL